MKICPVLSIIIPCYNEEQTLETCVHNVLGIQDVNLNLEIIIVDDCSSDKSVEIAKRLSNQYSEIKLKQHQKNQGKGSAIQTGIKETVGEFVAIQDADLEYDPKDLKKLLVPLVENKADVVFGSRFLSGDTHRVLYFWHSLGNKFLTFLSNMFTNLNLTDMETCYKVFRRNKLQDIETEEKRFGFEPEIVAKVAQKKLRIYEMGISYHGRTYEEGKKISWKDGIRALYCIFHYNAHSLPTPMQLLIYFFIGGFSAVVNLLFFILLMALHLHLIPSALISYFIAAGVNYLLCISLLFRHQIRWLATTEITMYFILVSAVALIDLSITWGLFHLNYIPVTAKTIACIIGFLINFGGRKYFIFWKKVKS